VTVETTAETPDDSGAGAAGVSHDERLLDESIEETFPASDPTSPVRPGSTLGLRYAAHEKAPETAGEQAERRTP
jgi:hypothetical protein